jgi:hypothetical protein
MGGVQIGLGAAATRFKRVSILPFCNGMSHNCLWAEFPGGMIKECCHVCCCHTYKWRLGAT